MLWGKRFFSGDARMRRIAFASGTLSLLLGACSAPTSISGVAKSSRQTDTPTAAAMASAATSTPQEPANADAPAAPLSDKARQSPTAGPTRAGGSTDEDPNRLIPPPAGRYRYAQKGWVESRVGPSTDRRELPPSTLADITQKTEGSLTRIRLKIPLDDQLEEEFRATISSKLMVLDAMTYRRTRLGVRTSQTIVFNPPIPVLSFPLKPGRAWDIRWYDRTTAMRGQGRGEVVRWERLSGPLGDVRTVLIVVQQEFTGPANGHATFRVWWDPLTGVIARLHVDSSSTTVDEHFSDEVQLDVIEVPQTTTKAGG